jgi:hypothetical protein
MAQTSAVQTDAGSSKRSRQDEMEAEIAGQRTEGNDNQWHAQKAGEDAVQRPKPDAGDERNRDRKPRIDVMKFDEQRREAARDCKDATNGQVDLDHRDQINHSECDDADQRRLAQNRLDRAEAEKLRIGNAYRERHCHKNKDEPAILQPAPTEARDVTADQGPSQVGRIRSAHIGVQSLACRNAAPPRSSPQAMCPHF